MGRIRRYIGIDDSCCGLFGHDPLIFVAAAAPDIKRFLQEAYKTGV